MLCGMWSAKLSPSKNFLCNYPLCQITEKNFKIFQFAKCSELGPVRGVLVLLICFGNSSIKQSDQEQGTRQD